MPDCRSPAHRGDFIQAVFIGLPVLAERLIKYRIQGGIHRSGQCQDPDRFPKGTPESSHLEMAGEALRDFAYDWATFVCLRFFKVKDKEGFSPVCL